MITKGTKITKIHLLIFVDLVAFVNFVASRRPSFARSCYAESLRVPSPVNSRNMRSRSV